MKASSAEHFDSNEERVSDSNEIVMNVESIRAIWSRVDPCLLLRLKGNMETAQREEEAPAIMARVNFE